MLQRAVFNGEDISLSRFEALAGKGDAKKWKTSLTLLLSNGMPGQVRRGWKGTAGVWACDGSISSCNCLAESHLRACPPAWHAGPYLLQTMQDWLDENRLDQRALDALANNAAEVQAWQNYNSAQGAIAGHPFV